MSTELQREEVISGPEPFSIEKARRTTIEAQPVEGPKEFVEADTFRVSHPDGWIIKLAVPIFSGGTLDVRCLDYSEVTPLPLHRLTRGLRMSILYTRTGEGQIDGTSVPFHPAQASLCQFSTGLPGRIQVRHGLQTISDDHMTELIGAPIDFTLIIAKPLPVSEARRLCHHLRCIY